MGKSQTASTPPMKIAPSEMTEAVARSGYLLEQRIVPTLRKADYLVDMNTVYLDVATGKTREYDFLAEGFDWPFTGYDHMVWTRLHGECINNPQPIVFFSHEDDMPYLNMFDVKCSGIPVRLATDHGSVLSIPDFFNFQSFHHYCKGICSTQYCSFVRKKGESKDWMAWHEEEQHSAFDSLVQSVKKAVDDTFSSWSVPSQGEKAHVDLNFDYPVAIVRGDLFECTQDQGQPAFTPREHIQYQKAVVSGRSTETYPVDVVVESFFPEYLDMIAAERKAVVNRLRRHKKQVLASVDRIVALARAERKRHKTKDFREILTSDT